MDSLFHSGGLYQDGISFFMYGMKGKYRICAMKGSMPSCPYDGLNEYLCDKSEEYVRAFGRALGTLLNMNFHSTSAGTDAEEELDMIWISEASLAVTPYGVFKPEEKFQCSYTSKGKKQEFEMKAEDYLKVLKLRVDNYTGLGQVGVTRITEQKYLVPNVALVERPTSVSVGSNALDQLVVNVLADIDDAVDESYVAKKVHDAVALFVSVPRFLQCTYVVHQDMYGIYHKIAEKYNLKCTFRKYIIDNSVLGVSVWDGEEGDMSGDVIHIFTSFYTHYADPDGISFPMRFRKEIVEYSVPPHWGIDQTEQYTPVPKTSRLLWHKGLKIRNVIRESLQMFPTMIKWVDSMDSTMTYCVHDSPGERYIQLHRRWGSTAPVCSTYKDSIIPDLVNHTYSSVSVTMQYYDCRYSMFLDLNTGKRFTVDLMVLSKSKPLPAVFHIKVGTIIEDPGGIMSGMRHVEYYHPRNKVKQWGWIVLHTQNVRVYTGGGYKTVRLMVD